MNFRSGDLVLINFLFTDETGTKRRPALVLSKNAYHRQRHEVIVAAVTSNIQRILPGDYRLRDWKVAGLLGPSVVTGIVRTMEQSMIDRSLGHLSQDDFSNYQQALRQVIDL